MPFSNALDALILDHLFSDPIYVPGAIFMGLSTADPLKTGAGLAEPVDNGYARVEIGAADFGAASPSTGIKTNQVALVFPTATGPQGIVTHFAFFDALVGGTFLGSSLLQNPMTVDAGITLSFPPGACEYELR